MTHPGTSYSLSLLARYESGATLHDLCAEEDRSTSAIQRHLRRARALREEEEEQPAPVPDEEGGWQVDARYVGSKTAWGESWHRHPREARRQFEAWVIEARFCSRPSEVTLSCGGQVVRRAVAGREGESEPA